ncbi:hypothetical protein COLO4_23470 [Corchorus olitorius]|uniref:Uncharacterized protein n=1 Tax=Corchorus olitorius TaxID=93759 RepID=A0A1R3IGD1_9ROSI|nr:hypothetical protein COLO4_23470 [Corchorus olitorius]
MAGKRKVKKAKMVACSRSKTYRPERFLHTQTGMHVIPIGQYIYWLPDGCVPGRQRGQGMMIDIGNESVSVISFDKATGLQLNNPSSFRGFGTIGNYVALVQRDYIDEDVILYHLLTRYGENVMGRQLKIPIGFVLEFATAVIV